MTLPIRGNVVAEGDSSKLQSSGSPSKSASRPVQRRTALGRSVTPSILVVSTRERSQPGGNSFCTTRARITPVLGIPDTFVHFQRLTPPVDIFKISHTVRKFALCSNVEHFSVRHQCRCTTVTYPEPDPSVTLYWGECARSAEAEESSHNTPCSYPAPNGLPWPGNTFRSP
jgi:hypothetical protein